MTDGSAIEDAGQSPYGSPRAGETIRRIRIHHLQAMKESGRLTPQERNGFHDEAKRAGFAHSVPEAALDEAEELFEDELQDAADLEPVEEVVDADD